MTGKHMKSTEILLLLTAICFGWTLSFGQTWIESTNDSSGFSSIACSADGSKIVAISGNKTIYLSTNAGVNWLRYTNNGNGLSPSVASSADGTILVVSFYTGYIYASTNSGNNWSSVYSDQKYWSSVTCSADGSKMFATESDGGRIYASTNTGLSWFTTTAPQQNWKGVASSADGTKLVAIASPLAFLLNGGIYTSTNSGTSWTQAPNFPRASWNSVASSANGEKLIAVMGNTNTPICISTNSGVDWTQITNFSNPSCFSVTTSADANQLVTGTLDSEIFISTKSGVSWTTNAIQPGNGAITSLASSADGSVLMAACGGSGKIYISRTILAPRLNIVYSKDKFILSWIVPSTNFVLQQSADMSLWLDLTNIPTLNFTSLQNQAVLSHTNSNTFYRLTTQ